MIERKIRRKLVNLRVDRLLSLRKVATEIHKRENSYVIIKRSIKKEVKNRFLKVIIFHSPPKSYI